MISPIRATVALFSLASLCALAACGDSSVTNVPNTATVRFANATDSSIDETSAAVVDPGNGNLGFGQSSTCTAANTSGTSGLGIGFNQAGTTTSIPGFTQTFASGGNYTVVAYPGSDGTTQFLNVDNAGFTPTTGNAGLRVVNGASAIGSVVAVGPDSALGTGATVGFGTAGNFMNVPADSLAVTLNTGAGTSTVADAGTLVLIAGQNYTLVVAPPVSGSATYRTFLVTGC
ncbi:MAG TPA: hypothetical protein VGM67_08320 [Gemmatimonadaceae bacterium]|jgi:hypothetical protein